MACEIYVRTFFFHPMHTDKNRILYRRGVRIHLARFQWIRTYRHDLLSAVSQGWVRHYAMIASRNFMVLAPIVYFAIGYGDGSEWSANGFREEISVKYFNSWHRLKC